MTVQSGSGQVDRASVRDGHAEDRRSGPDALTLAYIAIGARGALVDARASSRVPDLDWAGGESGFIDSVLSHALLLDHVADWFDCNGGHPVVFAYQVAEPFGEGIARAMIHFGRAVAETEDVKAIIAEVLGAAGYEPAYILEALKDALQLPASNHEYLFDVKLEASIRLTAPTEEVARGALIEGLDCASANLGEMLGQTIVCEVSLNGPPTLAAVDDVAPAPVVPVAGPHGA
ncbi:hypothetical protein [Burkholderia cepacia]|uniref:hypothetical protein n=1 Tax=Burkholderia cepacia TaxID=292 RepID=UPI002AB79C54|nr:hypothetical protein [Burkholderia cepacia]